MRNPTEKGHVLIVDDNNAITDIMVKLMGFLGYRADSSSNADEAKALFRNGIENNDRFDTVILDLTIPGSMGGVDILKDFKQADPEVKAIAITGNCAHEVLDNHHKYGFAGAISKPFTVDELSRTFREVLAANKC